MSFHYPRRVKDLPALEPDSDEEDENKEQLNKRVRDNAPVDNHSIVLGASSKSLGAYNNIRIPKRSSELPKLESDESEDEENLKTDNLNCAILNVSFMMSPGDNSMFKTPGPSSIAKKKRSPGDNNDNLSFLSDFDKLALTTENKENAHHAIDYPMPSIEGLAPPNAASTARKPLLTRGATSSLLQSIQEDKPIDDQGVDRIHRVLQDTTTHQNAKTKDMETPFGQISSTTGMTEAVANEVCTSSGTDAQFATPQIRSFPVQRRPISLCSTQSQKARSAIVNEFRSQKVLFQTPMATTREPIVCLPNDSISLSLCDTMNEASHTPSASENTTPCVNRSEKGQQSGKIKSKKSLEKAFANPNKPAESTETQTRLKSKEEKGKDSIFQINNVDYTIIKKLGCGGSSSVYLAQRNDDGKECALKVVDLRGDPAVVEGYLNETKLLAKLQGNACVVTLFEYQLLQKESRLFLVMEKGDSDLHKILQTYTTDLPLYVLMNFWYQMLQAVNYIHQNGVIHSDLKPANFLMINGRLKLIDFGIASNIALDSTSIIKCLQAGTFNYISPEALTDTSTGTSPIRCNQPKIKISIKSDVWSLGCILYLLIYKRTPFSHIKNIYAKISAISSPSTTIEYPTLPNYYPAMLVHMAKNCLQHNPKKRPSCAEMLQYPFNMVIPIQNLAVPAKVNEQN